MRTRAVPELCVFDLDACLWDKVGLVRQAKVACVKRVFCCVLFICFYVGAQKRDLKGLGLIFGMEVEV